MASNVVKIRFLTAAQVIHIHNILITASEPTQVAMLESAVQSPINIKHYTNEQNVFQLAASLSEKVIKNHALWDGNKRTALLAADLFLKINGGSLLRNNQYKKRFLPYALLWAGPFRILLEAKGKWTAEYLGQYYQQTAKELDEFNS
ncbi:DOC family protein [Bipolaris maydis]|nr:DOC family protein [Bipolaris maydis]